MSLKRLFACVCVAGLGAVSSASAQGQNPYFMTPQQYNFNGLQNAAARGQNPWLYGGGANPYTPYAGGAAAVAPAVSNPYMPGAYDPAFNPYFNNSLGPTGGSLYGQAEMLKAYSTVITSQEQARIIRQQAMQASIDTARKRFDFDLYVKANTPTYAEEQKKIAKNTIKRIQVNSHPVEIASGKALNILMDDVRNFPLKKANMDPISLSEDVLKGINITTKTNGVGILRNDGKFQWPTALLDILPPDQQKAIEKQVQIAVANAANGKVDRQNLDDLASRMEEVKRNLGKKVNDLPTGKYLDADRFLSDFRDARIGIEDGQMATQIKFNNFVKGGKNIQEVSDFMVSNGFKFAPSTGGADEASYRAFHSALVAFDIVLNTGTASEPEKNAPMPTP